MPMNMKREGGKTLLECSLCRKWFQFGEGVYEGRNVSLWDIQLCNWCLAANHDGIMLEKYPDLLRHLRAKGVPIALNQKGWLEIPPP
jgi:hypothetical protein